MRNVEINIYMVADNVGCLDSSMVCFIGSVCIWEASIDFAGRYLETNLADLPPRMYKYLLAHHGQHRRPQPMFFLSLINVLLRYNKGVQSVDQQST